MWSKPSKETFDTSSTWSFDTSEGAEFDTLFFACGKGSFYVKDSRNPDGIVHELLYVGGGVTKSKGPIPFGIGWSFSTPNMWSAGVGNINMKAGASSLALSDFGGWGLIVSTVVSAPILVNPPSPSPSNNGFGADIVYFGGLFSPKAMGVIVSKQKMPLGIGATAMPCYFVIDP